MLEEKIAALTVAVKALTAQLAATPVASSPAQAPDTEVTHAAKEQKEAEVSGPSEQDLKDRTLLMSRAGHKDAIREKLTSFGVTRIGQLDSAQAAEFYDWLGELS